MWQTKYASAVPKNLRLGIDFRPCIECDFLTGRPQSVHCIVENGQKKFDIKFGFAEKQPLSI